MNDRKALFDALKRLTLIFIREGTLVPAVYQLLHLHTKDMNLNADRDAALLNQLWKNVRSFCFPNSCFLAALKLCFSEYGSEIGEKIIQEIDSRQQEIPPGVMYYIALGLLAYLKDVPADNSKAYMQILKMAVIDIIQNPMSHLAFYAHESISSVLSLTSYTEKEHSPSWKFINDAVKNLDDLDISSLKRLVFSLISKVKLIESNEYGHTREIEVMEDYLSAHPQAVNDLVNDGFRKHEKLISRLDGIPILWHLSFLDQWIHEGRFVPKTFPKHMRLFSRDRYHQLHHFVNFCLTDKKRFNYFRLLSDRNLGHFISIMLANYIYGSLDKHFISSGIKLARFMNKLGRQKMVKNNLVEDNSALELKQMDKILKVIDPERMSFLKNNARALERFVEALWDTYFRNRFSDERFHEIHNTIAEHLASHAARRTAYLILMLKILKIKYSGDLIRVLNLMQRHFDLDRYHCSTEDLASVLNMIIDINIENLPKIYSKSDSKNKMVFESFVSTFMELFSEVYSVFDTEDRIKILRAVYRHLRPLSNTLDSIVTDWIEKIGIRRPFFDKGGVTILYATSYSREDGSVVKNAITVDPEDTLSIHALSSPYASLDAIPDWYLKASQEWERFTKEEKDPMGEIPLLYHPFYGYGICFIHSLHYGKLYEDDEVVVVLLGDTFPGEIKFKIQDDLVPEKYMLVLYDNREWKKYIIKDTLTLRLKGTPLENASIGFVKVEAASKNDMYPHKALLNTEDLPEKALTVARQSGIQHLTI